MTCAALKPNNNDLKIERTTSHVQTYQSALCDYFLFCRNVGHKTVFDIRHYAIETKGMYICFRFYPHDETCQGSSIILKRKENYKILHD